MHEPPDDDRRAQTLDSREAGICAREASAAEREQRLTFYEPLLRLREEALSVRQRTGGSLAERDDLVMQLREANEQLVFAVVRAQELTDEATASRNAFEASEQHFLMLANMVPMLVWYCDPQGRVLWFNRRWFDYTLGSNPSPQDLPDWEWASALDPADMERVLAKWRDTVASVAPWEDQFRLRRHDGVLRWFLARALPLVNSEGRIVRWYVTSMDIDDQKLAEAQADAGSRAKDEFLALLGHELRNPLAPITMALEVMDAGRPEVAVRERAIIARQVNHLIRLVDDLLDVSRITRGKVELKLERVEIATIVAHAIEMAGPVLEQKNHELTIEVPPVGLAVLGDADRIAQVFANLITNAAKYTDPGGAIELVAERVGTMIALRIRDNGIGISAQMLPRVFELFAQERQGLDRPQGGLGLGLAIAKNLVELHGGTTRAESDGVGRGSVFVVELPAFEAGTAEAPEQQGAVTTSTHAGARSDARLRILVVDDNEDAAEMMALALMGAGHEVRVASDGQGALAISEGFAPEVALLDIGLPGMDGYELVRRLRERLAGSPARFIAITGYGQARDRELSRAAGFDLHLVKPVGLAELQDAIARVAAAGIAPTIKR